MGHGHAGVREARPHYRRAGVVGRLRVTLLLLHRRHGGAVHACGGKNPGSDLTHKRIGATSSRSASHARAPKRKLCFFI